MKRMLSAVILLSSIIFILFSCEVYKKTTSLNTEKVEEQVKEPVKNNPPKTNTTTSKNPFKDFSREEIIKIQKILGADAKALFKDGSLIITSPDKISQIKTAPNNRIGFEGFDPKADWVAFKKEWWAVKGPGSALQNKIGKERFQQLEAILYSKVEIPKVFFNANEQKKIQKILGADAKALFKDGSLIITRPDRISQIKTAPNNRIGFEGFDPKADWVAFKKEWWAVKGPGSELQNKIGKERFRQLQKIIEAKNIPLN